jgi:hypothetical protein
LKEASNFVLNVNFEFLKGCPYSCKGCYVNKSEEKILGEAERERLLNFLDSSSRAGYKAYIGFVGPTDFLVADNTAELLSRPDVVEVLNKFKRLSFQTTYLNINNQNEIIEVLNQFYSTVEIEINIIIESANILNNQYLNRVEANKSAFLSELGRKGVRSFCIMNVYDFNETRVADLLSNYEFMHKRVQDLFGTTIDYNFSLGRKQGLQSEEFVNATERVKALFNQSVSNSSKAHFLRFSFGKLTDSLLEKQYNFFNGELYYSPLLYERFASFDERFLIASETLNIKEIEEYENYRTAIQYSDATSMDDCADCPFLGSCVDRGILFLMKTYNTKKCLVARDALNTINLEGTAAL